MAEKLSRRDFMRTATIIAGSAALTACAPKISEALTTDDSVLELFPTSSPPSAPTEIQTSTPEKKKSIDDLFKLGSFDTSKPFKIVAEEPLRRFTGHSADLTWNYSLNFPLVVRTDDPNEADPNGDFVKSIDDHHLGFYGFVFAANIDDPGQTRTVFTYHHSLLENPTEVSMGNFAYDIGAFAHKNPDKLDQFYQQTVKILYNGKVVTDPIKGTIKIVYEGEVEARIAQAITLPAAVWEGTSDVSLRDTSNKFGICEVETRQIEIPFPTGPNKFQLVVSACQSKIIGSPSLTNRAFNRANTSYVTLEFERPN